MSQKAKKVTGAALALAAAGMVMTSPASLAMSGDAGSSNVHCYGVNKCKGHNDCKTSSNACKGHAKCKGHGFVSMSATACDHVGGKVGK